MKKDLDRLMTTEDCRQIRLNADDREFYISKVTSDLVCMYNADLGLRETSDIRVHPRGTVLCRRNSWAFLK